MDKKTPNSTRDQVEGTLHEAKGAAKEKLGKLIGDEDMQTDGAAERIGGKVQKKVGQIEKVIGA